MGVACWLLHPAPGNRWWLGGSWRGLYLHVSMEVRYPASSASSHVSGSPRGVWIPSRVWLRSLLGSRPSPPASAGSLAGAWCTWGQGQLRRTAEGNTCLLWIFPHPGLQGPPVGPFASITGPAVSHLLGLCSFPHPDERTEQTKSKLDDLTVVRNSGQRRTAGENSSTNRKGSMNRAY